MNTGSTGANINSYHVHAPWANWGGFIMGLCFGLVMVPRARAQDIQGWGKLCNWIGWIWVVIFLAIVLPLFFTVYDPNPHF